MNIGEKLRELREANDLTQKDVADILLCSRVVYNRYENNNRQISIELLAKLAAHYKISLDYICGLENDFGKKVYE